MDDFARRPLKKRKKFMSHLKISPFRQRTDSPTLVGTSIMQKTQPVLLLVSLEGDLLLVARKLSMQCSTRPEARQATHCKRGRIEGEEKISSLHLFQNRQIFSRILIQDYDNYIK